MDTSVCGEIWGVRGAEQVETRTNRPGFPYGEFNSIRRFKDFEWLSHRLEEEFPGIVMPALPVKVVVGKFDAAFVEVRWISGRKTRVQVVERSQG